MPKYKVVDKIKDKGFPTSSKYYKTAHSEADHTEKSRNPKEYAAMKKVDTKLPKGELAGKNSRSGKIEVSKKVPAPYRADVANNHERPENKNIKRLEKNHKRK